MLSLTSKQNLRTLKNLLTALVLIISAVGTFNCNAAIAKSQQQKQTNVPGGIAIVDLEIVSAHPPTVFYNNQRTLVIAHPAKKNSWQAVVGIPLDAKAGSHHIELLTITGTTPITFNVQSKTYPSEKLTIKNKRKVQPLTQDMPIIEAQYLETIQTYERWQYQPVDSIGLKMPAKGRKSSPFGFQRIMNDIPQKPHSGLDIAAPKGTAVTAAKAGTVINIGNFFYSGNIVFVDHGQGFMTSYCHLDSVAVTVGQTVNTNTVLGTIGNTGRATGPHLHWSVSLNGVRVNPELFLNE